MAETPEIEIYPRNDGDRNEAQECYEVWGRSDKEYRVNWVQFTFENQHNK